MRHEAMRPENPSKQRKRPTMVNLLCRSPRCNTEHDIDIAVISGELDIALCKSVTQDGHCSPWEDAD
jgi:hypothetical protein